MNTTSTARPGRRLAAGVGAAVLLLGAAACGSDDAAPAATSGTASGATSGPQTAPGPGGGFPGADGKVAAVSGSTAQVQSQMGGQVAVTWTGATTFTTQVSAMLADVEVGSCVVVQPTEATADDSGDEPGSAIPTEVTAARVRISAKGSDGTCTGGMRMAGPPQTRGGGQPPADGSRPARLRGFGAVGEVEAVSGDGFTVAATVPKPGDSASGTPSTTTATVTVTVTGSTTYTTDARGSAADVRVGLCLRAEGTADSTGAVTAKKIALSPATDGGCGMVLRRAGQES